VRRQEKAAKDMARLMEAAAAKRAERATTIASSDIVEGAGGAPAASAREGAGGGTTGAEVGGPKGPEPTRFGDWERGGRCTDF